MDKAVLIFGAGQVAQVFADYLLRNHRPIAGFVVDRAAYNWDARTLFGLPVIAVEDLHFSHPPENHGFVIGMSFKRLNRNRMDKYQAMLSLGYEPLSFRHGMCGVGQQVKYGRGVFIQDLNNLQTGVQIGDNCVLWAGNHLGHHTSVGNHVWISSHCVISGDCEIGDRCFIGVNATIADGVKIGPDCIIGAGALITKDCAPDGVYGAPPTARRDVPATKLWRV